MEILVAVVLGIIAVIVIGRFFRKRYLMDKYHDALIVGRIMRKVVWEGETKEQLRDSLGAPVSIDHKVMKTRNREIWKYGRIGHRRYRTRVTIDDGIVAGWDLKD